MIATYIDLSTAHVSRPTMELLEDHDAWRRHGWPAMAIAPYPCGCFLTTIWDGAEPEALDRLPEDLARVLRFAKVQGISLVRLDSNGGVTHNLPVYDW